MFQDENLSKMSVEPIERKRPCLLPTCSDERFDLVHKFPMEKARAEMWLQALNMPELYDIPLETLRKTRFVCSRHFRNEDYKNPISRYLNKTAVPRLNLKNLDQMHLVLHRSVERPSHLLQNDEKRSANRINELLGKDNFSNLTDIDTEMKSVIVGEKNKHKIMIYENVPSTAPIVGTDIQNHNSVSIISIGADVHGELSDTEMVYSEHDLMDPISIIEFIAEEEEKTKKSEGSVPSDGDSPVTLITDDDVLILKYANEEQLILSHTWLRDHCRCELCFNEESSRKKFNLLDLDLNVKPFKTTFQDNILDVLWNDGHFSQYELDFLQQSNVKTYMKNDYLCERVLWNNEVMRNTNIASVSFPSYLVDEGLANQVLKNLLQFGFALVKNVPPNMFMTETVVKRLFPLQKTYFGEMWTLNDDQFQCCTNDKEEYISPHTETTYFSVPAGLQIFHCLSLEDTVREIVLIDGFHIATELHKKFPKSYRNLSTVDVPTEYIDTEKYYLHSAPVIKENSMTKELEQIRFNSNERSFFNSKPQEEMRAFYQDLKLFARELELNKNQHKLMLEPGVVLIIDNWRILHGHKCVGQANIVGCYVSREEFLSAARSKGVLS